MMKHAVIECAMKWLPHIYHENMEQYFAKGSMPLHESTFSNRVESGEVQKLTVPHVDDESETTYIKVYFSISDLLKQVKGQFTSVSKDTIQIYNAFCCHTSALVSLLLFANVDA